MNAAIAESQSKQTNSSGHFLDEIQQRAQNGDISAQRKLGLMYLTGPAVGSNLERARHWLGKAASKNDLEAQKSLGRIYAEGLGVKIDLRKSVEFFKLAAAQGDAISEASLGQAYEKGFSVNVNYSACWVM